MIFTKPLSSIKYQISNIPRISLWIFYGLLAYMPLHIFLSTWLGTSFGVLDFAKVAKDILLVVGFGLVLASSVRSAWFKEFTKDKLVLLIVFYAFVTLVMALVKPTDADAEILGVVYNLRFLLFFIYGLLLTRHYKPQWLQTRATELVLGVGVAVLVFGLVQYTLLPDTALTHIGYTRENGVLPAFFIDDKPDLERVMSTLRDPNSFGSYIIILLAIAVSFMLVRKNKELRRLLGGVVALGLLCLWLTFSRGAWLGAVVMALVAGAIYSKQQKRIKIDKRIVISVTSLLVLLAVGTFIARDTYFVKNVILHADESTTLEDPNELRLRFWQESLEAAADEPLGYGPGTAGLASIHNDKQGTILNENYYFQILHEVGVVGFAVFVAILAVIFKRLYAAAKENTLAAALLAAFVGLLVTNFFVHIWSNEAVAYTWWGLAGLVAATYNKAN